MKKLFFTLLLPLCSFAQNYVGLHSDNYKGVHGVLFNPASIAGSPLKADINILGLSLAADNDIYKLGFDMDVDDVSLADFSEDSNLYLNTDFLGLAFMMQINEKNSIALYSRFRAFSNGTDINGEIFDSFFDDFSDNTDYDIYEDGFHILGHTWAEIGLSYARVLLDKPNHFLTAGVSVKYLRGLGSVSVSSDNLRVAYDSATNTVDTEGEVTYYAASDLSENDFELAGDSGFGTDIGFVYEWRPNNEANKEENNEVNKEVELQVNKYKLKFGISVMDIGHIKYEMAEHKQYITNFQGIDENVFDEDNLQTIFDDLYATNDLDRNVKISLPTSLNLQADWNINNKFYVNLFSNISLVSRLNERSNNVVDNYIITPRFETKIFSAQLPISYSGFGNLKAGFGIRLGPFYVGSGSVLSNLVYSDSKSADAYIGMKIPVF